MPLRKCLELIEKIIQEEGTSGNKGDTSNCVIGSIFYSDWTCSTSLDSSKTPIAVVVYTSGEGHGQAMALKSIGNYKWGGYGTDIPGLNNFSSDSSASTDLQSCSNTVLIMVAGDKSEYPAAWAAKEYSTDGTKAGDWCLPAAGIMTSIKNNMSAINAGFILGNGTQLKSSILWTSSEFYNDAAHVSAFDYDYGLHDDRNHGYKGSSYDVRPVLEF